ncbi:DUF2460 domain-containing protein [Pacificimonas flava]|uniref:TIGR02217 family protein n=1 Tax=Pacificimonas flava TaxID=1234595 RepID=M2TLE1_9SPHN|nr:DUF2460 domain-containing protein [Pacificimonas flava]EMD82486.1 hypothetical protein C725_2207 [Pacificimonas flava]MBB5281318.1 uncharacterized protein (TIGR02217 family) [Pacificimonas flava]
MSHYLADGTRPHVRTDWMMRFDAAHWSLNFPRPMMAAVTVPQPGSLKVDLAFLKQNDLAGLIWESEDRRDHPLLRYETRRDYRGLALRFRWRSEGEVRPLDAVDGPTLTIEGRTEGGEDKTWYVRLWNYADGAPDDARITLDFDAMEGGFLLPGESDPVWAGDIDRMFVSLVPAGFTRSDAPLPAPAAGSVVLEDLHAEGAGAVLEQGDASVPPHALRMATGYDDQYDLTPTRILRNVRALGYRDWLTLYVGMSHFMRVAPGATAAGEPVFRVSGSGDPLCEPARAWFRNFAALAAEDDITPIWSLSYELFDAYAPEDWKQRAHDGRPALTGWEPPSTLLSPANDDAMAWLRRVAGALMEIGGAFSKEPWFQVGEPWWWTGFGDDRVPCFYDAAALSAYSGDPGDPITDTHDEFNAAQGAYAEWLGGVLGASVLSLADAARGAAANVRTALLFYAPQVLTDDAEWLRTVNMPAAWAYPAFDCLQLEDYDFVLAGDVGASRRARAAVTETLGYPAAAQDYFSGFVLNAGAPAAWTRIASAAEDALNSEVSRTFVWALPQVMRDGFTFYDVGEGEDMEAFHDVRFPLSVGAGASGGPEFLTEVTEMVSGREQRSSVWAAGRLQFDAGLGVRSEDDLIAVLNFFRARKGRAHGFRFRDPFDHASASGNVGPFDQYLGTADGLRTDFPLLKRYGESADAEVRRITRPDAASLRIAVGGEPRAAGWSLRPGGVVRFDEAPTAGGVTAGFHFDVPVRFAEDRLTASLGGWRAGEIPSIPLIEVREDG